MYEARMGQTNGDAINFCVCVHTHTHAHKHSHTQTPNTNTQALQGDGANDKRGFAHKEAVAANAVACLHRHIKLFPGGLGLENVV
jgi:hypothetical protein